MTFSAARAIDDSPDRKNIAETLSALVASDGTAFRTQLSQRPYQGGAGTARSLADAAHHICGLHGRHPGIVDIAAGHAAPSEAREWLAAAVTGFAVERLYLTNLVVAVGPLPSTPGQAESETAALAQRHALEMLAASERTGCALGAAMALALDWPMMRAVLDAAAGRFGIDPPAVRLPDAAATFALAGALAGKVAVERALLFGAQQLLLQHRGLWSLLDARRSARNE